MFTSSGDVGGGGCGLVTAPNVPKVKVIKPDKYEVELAGVRYIQVPYDRPSRAKHPCHWCVAACNFPLCDLLCPYCKERFVFQRKVCQ